MKNYFLISILILAFNAEAQLNKFSASAEIIGGIGLVTYSNDSLVPPKRRGKSRFDDLSFINGYFSFSLRNPRYNFKTGIGYSHRDFQLNKNNLGDFFIAIFSFGSNPSDTFKIQQVKMNSQYLNVPIGFSYRLTKDKNKVVEFRVGLQVNSSFLVGQQVTVTFDPFYFTPTPQQAIEIEKEYAATERTFVISIQPRMDLRVRIYRNMGLFTNLQPVIINLKSYNTRLVKTRSYSSASFGVYFDF